MSDGRRWLWYVVGLREERGGIVVEALLESRECGIILLLETISRRHLEKIWVPWPYRRQCGSKFFAMRSVAPRWGWGEVEERLVGLRCAREI
jgi:hypothetical protein